MRVLHVIECLSRGGASRSLVALARRTAGGRAGAEAVLSLRPAEAAAAAAARDVGLEVYGAGDAERTQDLVRAADIVHVHFWNTPELFAWLHSRIPPVRLLLTLHVAGEHPAQIVSRRLLEHADFVVATTSYSLELEAFRQLPQRVRENGIAVLPGACEPSRLQAAAEPGERPFTVGYVGTVGFVKLHPRFVDFCAAVRIPVVRFLVVGGGDAGPALRRQAEALGVAERFEWAGWTEDVGAALHRCDVLGYPLRADSYATSDLAVQEAMSAGVPPVLLDHGAVARLVRHGETGLVVAEGDYARALERLHADASERRRLGSNARAYAQRSFGAENLAPKLGALYEGMLGAPKREREWPQERLSGYAGADAFVQALGDAGGWFRTSLAGDDAALEAEDAIAGASPVVTDAAAGGVLHYRRYYPNDAYLRLWAGLVLERRGRPALAAAEFHQAREMGLAHTRVHGYLQRALRQAL